MPKSNSAYWHNKLKKNVERDSRNYMRLREMGWDYLVIWECELANRELVAEKILTYLG